MGYKNPEDAKAYDKKWRVANRDKVNAIAYAWRKRNLEKYNAGQRRWWHKHREERLAKDRIRASLLRKQWRTTVLGYYSNGSMACACCGETTNQFLTIDHIKGGGRKHYATEIKKNYSGIYQYLKAKKFPKGYQVLCWNCNSAKGIYGICPHLIAVNGKH